MVITIYRIQSPLNNNTKIRNNSHHINEINGNVQHSKIAILLHLAECKKTETRGIK